MSLGPILLTNTAVALALAVPAMLAAACRRPAVAHTLWLLVLIKLVTPPLVLLPVIGPASPRVPAVPAPALAPSAQTAPAPTPLASTPVSTTPLAVSAPPRLPELPVSTPGTSPPARGMSLSIEAAPYAAWAVGSAALLALVLIRLRRFHALLGLAGPAPAAVQAALSPIAAALGLRTPPATLVLPAPVSPMLYCLGGRPRLLLPQSLLSALSPAGVESVVAHELAHLRRHDHLVRLVEAAVTVAFWWHPLVWLARRGLHAAEEQACDALVLARLPHLRGAYAAALVDTLELVSVPPPAGATGLGRLSTLERRLAMILNHAPRTPSAAARLAVLAVGLGILPLAPTRAQVAPPAAPPVAATTPAAVTDDVTSQAVRALLEAATDADPHVSEEAITAIIRFGPAAVPALCAAAGDARLFPIAQNVLMQAGPSAGDALFAALDDPRPAARAIALQALGSLAPPQRPAERPAFESVQKRLPEALVPRLADADPAVRQAAVIVWGRYASKMLDDEQWKARGTSDGPAFRPGTDAQGRRKSLAAAFPLPAATVARYVAPLLTAMKDPESTVRAGAADALGNLSPWAVDGIVPLTAAAEDGDAYLREVAIRALAQFGAAARGSTPALTRALKSSVASTRAAAAAALGQINADPNSAVRNSAFNGMQEGAPADVP